MKSRRKALRGQGSLVQRGDIWHYSFYVAGERYRGSTGLANKKEAIEFLTMEMGRVATLAHEGEDLKPNRVKIGKLFEMLLDHYEIHAPEAEHTKISILKVKRHLMPYFGSILAKNLTTNDVNVYVKRRQKVAKNATVNRELSLLHKAFSLAHDAEPRLVNHIPTMKKLREDNVRTGFLRVEEYKALRDALVDPLKLLFVFAYHLGMRLGELLKIRKNQVDRDAGLIWLEGRQTKNKQPRTAPIYGEMAAFLDMVPQNNSQLLFCWLDGSPIKDFRESWKQATAIAGVPALMFHDLRRTAVRNMRRAGVDEQTIRKIIGHKTDAMFRRYSIIDEEEIQEAGKKVEAYFQREQKPETGKEKVQ